MAVACVMRQTLYAQYDMALHTADALKVKPFRNLAKMEAATALGYVPTTEFPGQFGHLMGGYQAGYYGYMWSEVLALDMLSAYGDNLNNPQVGQRYRQTILSQGSQNRQLNWLKISLVVILTIKHSLTKLPDNGLNKELSLCWHMLFGVYGR